MRLNRSIRSVGLVTLITALIWLYAEGQDVTDRTPTISLTLPPRVGEAMVVDFANGIDRRDVTITLKGAGAQVSDVETQLIGSGTLALPLEPSDLPTTGRANVSLLSLISRARLSSGATIGELGVSVADVEPASVELRVDLLVERKVRVLMRAEGVEVGPNVRIEPAEVTITAPKSLIDRYATSEDVLHVWAELPPAQLAALPEGVEQTISAPVRPADVFSRSRHVSVATPNVDVTFTIARQRDTATKQLVPVWVMAPPTELTRFKVVPAEGSAFLRDVVVTGPRDLVEELKQAHSELRLIARFEVTGDDLERGVTSAPVSSLELQRVAAGRTQVLHVVPLNPEALQPGAGDDVPAFLSDDFSVLAPDPVVRFTVTRVEQ